MTVNVSMPSAALSFAEYLDRLANRSLHNLLRLQPVFSDRDVYFQRNIKLHCIDHLFANETGDVGDGTLGAPRRARLRTGASDRR